MITLKSKILIDLGTYNTKIYKLNAGIVLSEPTLIITELNNYKKVIAFGLDAEKLLDKTTPNMSVIRPLSFNGITNEKALTLLLGAFISKIKEPGEINPNVVLSLPLGTDRQTIKQMEYVFNKIGIYNLEYIESPFLSIFGTNAQLDNGRSAFLVDIGGSQATICSLSLNGIIFGGSINLGGDCLNSYIKKQLETESSFSITDYQIEVLKTQIGSLSIDDSTTMAVSGKNYQTSVPCSFGVSASDIYSSFVKYADTLIEFINKAMAKLPAAVLEETKTYGIYLTGGGSKIFGLNDYLSLKLEMNVNTCPQAELATIKGGITVMNDKKLFNNFKIQVN